MRRIHGAGDAGTGLRLFRLIMSLVITFGVPTILPWIRLVARAKGWYGWFYTGNAGSAVWWYWPMIAAWIVLWLLGLSLFLSWPDRLPGRARVGIIVVSVLLAAALAGATAAMWISPEHAAGR